ncbi:MAG TPA: hypothetical protein VF157_10310 [Chloroflexota bacterium]
MIRRLGWWLIVAAVVIAILVGIGNLPTTTRTSINYTVSSQRIPLYQKALSFIDRDVEMRALAARVLPDTRDREAALMRLLDWTHQNVRPTPAGFPVVDDHPYNIVVRGYGPADQAADVFAIIASYRGIPATLDFCHDAAGQTVYAMAVAQVDGAWRLIDPREGRAFKNTAGKLASIDELKADPSLVAGLPVPAESHGHDYAALVGELDPIGSNLRPAEQMPLSRLWSEIRRPFGGTA